MSLDTVHLRGPMSLDSAHLRESGSLEPELRLGQLFRGLVFLRTEAARMGLLHRINVVVMSEFGRTPAYNGNNGKDHHSVGSWMTMLWGSGQEDFYA